MADPQRIKSSPFRPILRILALVLILVSTAFWISTGSHTGFSKDRVEIPQVDPITQIEYVDYEESFVMGVEFLALACGLGVISFGLSFAFRRKPN
ncbi:MAG: hypothetical protein VXU50_05960 [Verrucomicrobiota bacterium]|nr:hypothetical protein [Verrucomicrobiota bacterium]